MNPIGVRAFYTYYPHIGAYSGFRQILRHLDPLKVSVSTREVSDSDADWPFPETPLNARLRTTGVRGGMAWYKLSDLAAELRALPACLANTFDIVHFLDAEHTGQFLPSWIRKSRISRVRTIATFHQPPELLGNLVNPDAVRRLDLALAISPTQVPFLRQFLPAHKVITLLHGIDTTFFRSRESRQPPRQVFRCITAGHWLRDWEAMRAVATRLADRSDLEFHVVTDRQIGLEDLPNVQFHRGVNDDALLSLYQEADILFLPLTNATANNCLLEGMACGLPVVSTRLEAVRAYINDRCAILADRNDPDALARALVQLLNDLPLRTAMSHAARARAEALAWPNAARTLTEVYSALLS